MTHSRRVATLSAVVWLAVVVLAGCGTDGPEADPAGSSALSSTAAPDTAGAGTADDDLEGLHGELVITRQRDLLDRGLINVLTRNDSGHTITVLHRALLADFFTAQPAEPRTTVIPDGRRTAIQVPYGRAEDCDTQRPVDALFTFTYTTHTGATARRGSIAISGTEILDDIRARQCTTQAIHDQTKASFDNVVVTDGTVTAQLTITKTDGTAVIHIGDTSGTILVAVRTAADYRGATLSDAGDHVTVPLTFVVNRCDPHALAEVTKRYGLDLAVTIDAREPIPISIDVDGLTDELETIVQECRDESLVDESG